MGDAEEMPMPDLEYPHAPIVLPIGTTPIEEDPETEGEGTALSPVEDQPKGGAEIKPTEAGPLPGRISSEVNVHAVAFRSADWTGRVKYTA